jgi:preprotein translocase subunit SecY
MIENFLNSIRNVFSVPDLRKRVFFTLGLLAVYRLGSHVRVPGVDPTKLAELWQTVASSLLGVLDLFSGGNLQKISIFALGIMPYITASIILQLMTVVSPRLKAIQEEGEMGRRKMNQWTRYLTVVLGFIQTITIAMFLQNQPGLVYEPGIGFIALTSLTLTTGTIFIMWLGEQITERGIGNGISLIIFAGIIIGAPQAAVQIYDRAMSGGTTTALGMILLIVGMLAIIAAIVFMERGLRKIPINHARRQVGRTNVPMQQTTMPLKVNMGGVIPVIFAASIMAFPQTLANFIPNELFGFDLSAVQQFLGQVSQGMGGGGHPLYMLLDVVAIIFFTFFYVSIIFNTDEVADNLRKHGQFIPGIRPGKRTADYLNGILTRLTTVGAVYLAVLVLIPQIMLQGVAFQQIPGFGPALDEAVRSNVVTAWIATGMGLNFKFGGTSLLIVVGVAMDTMQQVEAQLIMRHYDGFLGPGGRRLRGRRVPGSQG